jgi:biopolymer transport protein ExbB/TolQ
MLDPTIVSFIAIGTTIIGVATSAVLAVKATGWKRAADEARRIARDFKAKRDLREGERDTALHALAAAQGELITANVELTAFRAAEKRRQGQARANLAKGRQTQAEARAAANGAA